MLLEIIKQLNWIDIFVVFLAIRVLSVAVKKGFPVELFKLLGTLSSLFISLHYYTAFSDYIGRYVKQKMPLDFLDFLCFLVIAEITYLIFVLLRSTFFQLIRMEAVSKLNKWGGLFLGALRAFLLSALVIFTLTISGINYLKQSVVNSYSGVYLFGICQKTYVTLWDSFFSKFMAKEQMNRTIAEVESTLRK